jgi:hypothetical protein
MYGSERGALGNQRSYRDLGEIIEGLILPILITDNAANAGD